jgi:hypothetical protein
MILSNVCLVEVYQQEWYREEEAQTRAMALLLLKIEARVSSICHAWLGRAAWVCTTPPNIQGERPPHQANEHGELVLIELRVRAPDLTVESSLMGLLE